MQIPEITLKDMENIKNYLSKLDQYKEAMKNKYIPILSQAKTYWQLKNMYERQLEKLVKKKSELEDEKEKIKRQLSKNPELITESKKLTIEIDKTTQEILGLGLAFGEVRKQIFSKPK